MMILGVCFVSYLIKLSAGRGCTFIHLCSQTIKTIDFKRSYSVLFTIKLEVSSLQ